MFVKATIPVMKVVAALRKFERSRLRERYQRKPWIILKFPLCYINKSDYKIDMSQKPT